jgi:hypothetical protein
MARVKLMDGINNKSQFHPFYLNYQKKFNCYGSKNHVTTQGLTGDELRAKLI